MNEGASGEAHPAVFAISWFLTRSYRPIKRLPLNSSLKDLKTDSALHYNSTLLCRAAVSDLFDILTLLGQRGLRVQRVPHCTRTQAVYGGGVCV